MTYDESICYWCGKQMKIGERAYSSIATDTIRTKRNFCSPGHLNAFKLSATGEKCSLKLSPYHGYRLQLTNDQTNALETHTAELEAQTKFPRANHWETYGTQHGPPMSF